MALQANSSDFIGLRTDVPCKAFRRVCVRFFYTALVEDTRCRIGAIPSAHGFRSVFMRRRFARGIMRHASDEYDYRQVRRENSWLYGCIAAISSPDVHSAAETKTSRRYPYSLNYTIFLCVKLLPLSALWLYLISGDLLLLVDPCRDDTGPLFCVVVRVCLCVSEFVTVCLCLCGFVHICACLGAVLRRICIVTGGCFVLWRLAME